MANTSTGTNTVVAYFSSLAKAQTAVGALRDAGFKSSEIGLAARGEYFGDEASPASSTETTSPAYRAGEQAGEHTAGMWHKIKNFFEGGEHVETGQARVANQYPYGEFGPGEMRYSLTELSVPEQNSRYFENRFANEKEGAVVTVTTADRQDEAAAILEQNEGDLGRNAETYDYSTANRDTNATQAAGDTQNIRLYGEVLRVHKDRINRGEVRVRKEVITDTQTVQVPVTREELVIERNPVTGEQPATDATFEGQEIRIPLTEEKASVEKQPVVREEVRVGKREVSNVQSVDEQVRHEELNVDDTTKSA